MKVVSLTAAHLQASPSHSLRRRRPPAWPGQTCRLRSAGRGRGEPRACGAAQRPPVQLSRRARAPACSLVSPARSCICPPASCAFSLAWRGRAGGRAGNVRAVAAWICQPAAPQPAPPPQPAPQPLRRLGGGRCRGWGSGWGRAAARTRVGERRDDGARARRQPPRRTSLPWHAAAAITRPRLALPPPGRAWSKVEPAFSWAERAASPALSAMATMVERGRAAAGRGLRRSRAEAGESAKGMTQGGVRARCEAPVFRTSFNSSVPDSNQPPSCPPVFPARPPLPNPSIRPQFVQSAAPAHAPPAMPPCACGASASHPGPDSVTPAAEMV